MYVVYKINKDSVLEVGEIMFMKLYIHFGELNVSLTASGLWISAAGVVAEKLTLAIPVTWKWEVMKDNKIKYYFVMTVDLTFLAYLISSPFK